ncbi:MAG: hypothetical protein KA735_06895 [Burkholderiaceae bacterium]|nr:hypothetical protein [Burkholderiaceae bacterium]
MKNLFDQGAWRSAYVNTRKTDNAERADFPFLPAGLGPEQAACGVARPRKALALLAARALHSARSGPNAISLSSVNRPYHT